MRLPLRRPIRGGYTKLNFERAVFGLSPFSWLRSDNYTSSGGKVTAWQDMVQPGHTFAQATDANRTNDPVADAALGGRASATFAGSQRYDSSLAAASWDFLHNGTGGHSFTVFVHTNTVATRPLWTNRALTGVELGSCLMLFSSHAANVTLNNGATSIINLSSAALTASVGQYIETSYQESLSPEAALYAKASLAASGNSSQAPSASPAAGTMRLGASTSNNAHYTGRWAETIWFNRVLSAAERAIVQGYMASYYGLV